MCWLCNRKGQLASICRTGPKTPQKSHMKAATTNESEDHSDPSIASVYLAVTYWAQTLVPVKINNLKTKALLENGSEKSFITTSFLRANNLLIDKSLQVFVVLSNKSKLALKVSFTGELCINDRCNSQIPRSRPSSRSLHRRTFSPNKNLWRSPSRKRHKIL